MRHNVRNYDLRIGLISKPPGRYFYLRQALLPTLGDTHRIKRRNVAFAMRNGREGGNSMKYAVVVLYQISRSFPGKRHRLDTS